MARRDAAEEPEDESVSEEPLPEDTTAAGAEPEPEPVTEEGQAEQPATEPSEPPARSEATQEAKARLGQKLRRKAAVKEQPPAEA